MVEFARLSPKELLAATEAALGSSELQAQHAELTSSKADIADLEKSVAGDGERLERLKGENEALERDVAKFKAREEKLAAAALQRAKLPWLKYEAARKRFAEAKEACDAAKKSADAKEAALTAANGPLRSKEAAEAKAVEALKAANAACTGAEKVAAAAFDKAGKAADDVETARNAVDAERARAAATAARLAKLGAEVEKLRVAASAAPAGPTPHQLAEFEDLKARLRAATDDAREAEAGVEELKGGRAAKHGALAKAREALESMQAQRTQRIKALASNPSSRQLPAALDALDKLRLSLSAPVLGPILCECAVPIRQHAGFLEQHVKADLWSAMVVTGTKDDYNKVSNLLRPFNISVSHFMGDPNAPIHHPVPAALLASLGVTHTLDEVFDAPPAVKGVLQSTSRLGTVHVGTAAAEQHWEALQAKGVRSLMTPSFSYRAKTSRYDSGNHIVNMMASREPRLFTSGSNPAAIAAAQQAVKDAEADLEALNVAGRKKEAEKKDLDRAVDDLARKKDTLAKTMAAGERARRSAQGALAAKEKALEADRAQSAGKDGVARLIKAVEKAVKKQAEAAVASAKAVAESAHRVLARAPLAWAAAELKEQARVLNEDTRERSGEAARAKATHASLVAAVAQEKAAAKAAHADAERGGALDEARKAAFNELPDTEAELEALIETTTAEADSILCNNPGAVAEYTKKKAEIAELSRSHAKAAAKLAGAQAHIDGVKAAWLPKLRALFARISAAFGSAMAAIGCAGEVRLHEAGDNFADYEVLVMVKFRAKEELQQLTSHRQSGGERSVSTMCYLIALQDLTSCPFRVVDEINQGMDPKNERKIFQQMVASATAPGTPQCFLLTPKLLPQLDYSRHVTVLNIFNGPRVADVTNHWAASLFTGDE